MRNLQEQPSEATLYTITELEALGAKPLVKLTRHTADKLAVNRLLLGRCLVAIDSTSAYERIGCNGSIHYATLLGVERREALDARRVASRLEDLPLLRAAADGADAPALMLPRESA